MLNLVLHNKASMKTLKDLKAWLKVQGNTEAKLAVELGYRDAAAIKQWIRRGRIPSYQLDRVISIINTKKEHHNVVSSQHSS